MAVSSMETGHICRIGDIDWSGDTAPSLDDRTCGARQVEPWLSAILQAEHLSLLLGNGVTTAAVSLAGGSPVSMTGKLQITGSSRRNSKLKLPPRQLGCTGDFRTSKTDSE